ncbi:sugar porter family MFS transporter [Fulvivirgaceae bacterium BMA12]|uniref:Sugar porter family MFS transporter n=1 Tax=Agaribacillus aureus TaxID=3051825 RepID=A0ABT8L7I1_9BACT|nr:sugar porter family MFS transporter [Fulvivirgaceae bacterium BMA12]
MRNNYNFKYIAAISMVSALGGLLFGYDWVVIGGAKPFYEQFFDIATFPELQGWAMSCALIGCIGGTVLSGMLADNLGRKKLLIAAAALFVVSALGTGLANQFWVFVLYRVIGGVGIGLASNLSPMYIAEVAPANIRGRFVAVNQLTIVIGILLAQIINWMIAEPVSENATAADILNSWNGKQGWRYMFWAEAIPAMLFFILMWFVPDSPRWLMRSDKTPKANAILKRIGGELYAENAIAEIKTSILSQDKQLGLSALLNKKIWPVLIIGVVLAVFQQWCGINVIFLYAEEVFASAGYHVSDMLFNVIIIGSVNLLFTIVAMTLVDKIGRKSLMLIGSFGLMVIYAIMGTLYFLGVQGAPLLILVVSAIACYAMTLAPVVWIVLSEIFPNKIRGAAMAVATFMLWTSNALLAFFFPIVNKLLNASGTFWLFAVICGAGFLFVWFRTTETKGKTLEEIERELNL